MRIKTATESEINSVRLLYNSITGEQDIYYKPLSADEFNSIFKATGREIICAFEDDILVAFAAGTAIPERGSAYITYVGTKYEYRKNGIGSQLLDALEEKLKEYKDIKKIEIVFHNPACLPWLIPNGNGADHPCAPGVDITTTAYRFFKKNGYFDWAEQNSYYLALADYREPDDIAAKRAALTQKGIEITLYNSAIHHGLAELFDDINNPGWKCQVLANTDKPIIVAIDNKANGLVCAYTGPLSVQASGRGNFCGIGTLNAYRGHGIGKVVFCEMCRRHSEAGAKFMTLYTGDKNPARYIYEAAGFTIVRSWANMRKEI